MAHMVHKLLISTGENWRNTPNYTLTRKLTGSITNNGKAIQAQIEIIVLVAGFPRVRQVHPVYNVR